MDLESMKKLRLDRRLSGRRGWIDASKFAQAIDDLPDARDKVAPPEESGEVPSAATEAGTAE